MPMTTAAIGELLNEAFRLSVPDEVDLWPAVRQQLHSRFNQPEPSTHTARNSLRQASYLRRTLLAALAVFVALALIFSVSPAVRAMVVDALRRIGGIDFSEQQQLEPEVGNIVLGTSQVAALAEAQAKMPFAILMPTWLPEGYAFDGNVLLPSVEIGVPHVALNWLDEEGNLISLNMIQTELVAPLPVGEGALGEVEVGGKTVAVIAGGH